MADEKPGLRTIPLGKDTGNTGHTARDEPDPMSVPRSEQAPPPAPDAPRTAKFRRMETQLGEAYAMLGVGIGMAEPFTGMLVSRRAGDLAEAWIDLAERDAKVARALEQFLGATGWFGVITAHASIGLTVAAAMGKLPGPANQMIIASLLRTDPDLVQMFAQGDNGNGNGPQA